LPADIAARFQKTNPGFASFATARVELFTYIPSLIVDRKEFAATDKLNPGPHLQDLQVILADSWEDDQGPEGKR
jgi:hypothetical protein